MFLHKTFQGKIYLFPMSDSVPWDEELRTQAAGGGGGGSQDKQRKREATGQALRKGFTDNFVCYS